MTLRRLDLSREMAQRILLVVLALVGLFYVLTLREGNWLGSDASLFLLHARNIFEGVAYDQTGYIFNPARAAHSPQTYPPVFPVLLAPVYAIFGLQMTVFKIMNVVIFLIALYVMYRVFRGEIGDWYAVGVISVVGLTPTFWAWRNDVLSEFAFVLFVFVALWFLNQPRDQHRSLAARIGRGAFGGLLIYLAVGTRSIGIVLIPSLLLSEVLIFRRLTAFAISATAISATLIGLQEAFLTTGGGYMDQALFDLIAIRENMGRYARGVSVAWFGGLPMVLTRALFVITTLVGVVGYIAAWRKRATPMQMFALFYPAAVVVWPHSLGARYMIPALPFFAFYAVVGLKTLGSIKGVWWQRVLLAGIVTPLVASFAIRYARANYRPLPEGFQQEETVEFFSFIQQQTAVDDVMIFTIPRTMALVGRRASSTIDPTLSDAEQWQYFEDIGATHIVTYQRNEEDVEYLRPFLERYESRVERVFTNDLFGVFRIK